jgi:hypothetical protein
MPEEDKTVKQKRFETRFIDNAELPTHFVNTVNVRPGLEEFYFTLGTALPIEVKDIEDLEQINTIEARPFFQFVVTRDVMRQLISLMEKVYNQQTEQIEALRRLQEQGGNNQ